MPQTAPKIWKQLNIAQDFTTVRISDVEQFGGLPAGSRIGKAEQLFPRIEVEK